MPWGQQAAKLDDPGAAVQEVQPDRVLLRLRTPTSSRLVGGEVYGQTKFGFAVVTGRADAKSRLSQTTVFGAQRPMLSTLHDRASAG
jgi:hypothetical protein